jgi:hypothetical protein
MEHQQATWRIACDELELRNLETFNQCTVALGMNQNYRLSWRSEL